MPEPKTHKSSKKPSLTPTDFGDLAEIRSHLASFLRRRSELARAEGVEPQQFELMLAIGGPSEGTPQTITDLARRLGVVHHAAVELVNRLAAKGMVVRTQAESSKRKVVVCLTPAGERVLKSIASKSLQQVSEEVPGLIDSLRRVLKRRAEK
jgi:DNA-binding MarR family transcriptional regulator